MWGERRVHAVDVRGAVGFICTVNRTWEDYRHERECQSACGVLFADKVI